MFAEIQKIENAARLSFGDFTDSRSSRPARSRWLAPLSLTAAAVALPVVSLFLYF